MAGNILAKYGSSNQAITITVTSLTTGSLRGSTAVDNSSNLFTNALVHVKIKTNAAGTSATGYVDVYAYGSADGGTTYSGGFAGTDGAYSGHAGSLKKIGRLPAVANATTYSDVFPVNQGFGGDLPEKWGIVVDNESGATLDASIGSAWYQGTYGSYV